MSHDKSFEGGQREPIAVIGSGFRFPGSSKNPSKLWELLIKPRDLLTKIPENRFNIDNFYHPNPSHHGTTDVKESYFLEEDHRHFDAGFFNIKPVEVHAIDPQQRLLMEVVYESLEASGLSVEALAGSRTGVYVGLMCADYSELLNSDMNTLPTYTPTGNARSIMSNRISYFFDWHGPSMTIDTACSSSLVAVHQAVQLLRSGDSDIAVAAGSNLILGPGQYVGASKLHMLSPDSRSRMWDVDATGYARGEGVAAVVLKRLSSAIADGDNIECIIRESGINQDGRTKGITMPSSTAQKELIEKTYAKAGLDPRHPHQRCQYFEAHGTGTAAGDPKEAEAISQAFFHPGDRISEQSHPLYVGSIKTVIGHTEGTAGLAGLLKASLAVQHGIIPPNLLFNKIHPAVEPFYTNLEISTSPKPWPKLVKGAPRRASVNSFGFGGTNAHVIIENFVPSPIDSKEVPSSRQFTPFNFSAASAKSLRGILADYSEYLLSNPDVNLRDLSYTLYARKSEHNVRTSISAKSTKDLHSKIDAILQELPGVPAQSMGIRSKALSNSIRALGVFTGAGAQWPTMGRELILHSPYARRTIQELDMMLQQLPELDRPDWSLMDQLTCDASKSRLDSAVVAQPLCNVIQIILYDLLTSAGVRFHAVVGHSSGEIAAAYAAGQISRDESVKIAYYRGYFTNFTPPDQPGAMIAIGTSVEDANELCNLPIFQGRLVVAAINSSSSVTLSGDCDAIEQAKEILEDEKKFARILKVDKAYHSSHMIPCAVRYLEALKRCKIQPRQATSGCLWFSSAFENRTMHGDQDLSGQYWADNMVRPVLFSHAIQTAAAAAGTIDISIEVGPHATLKGPVLQTLQEIQKEVVPYSGLLSRGKDDIEAFSDALGFIWSQFSSPWIDFRKFDSLVSGCGNWNFVNPLPNYRWDHEKLFWHGSRASKVFLTQKNLPNPLLGARTPDTMEQEIRWRNLLRLSELPWIRGHQLQGQIIYPATAYISTAVEAARFLVTNKNISMIEVEDFSLGKPLVFRDDDAGIETVFTLSCISKESQNTYSASFTYHACANVETGQLSTHATGRVIVTTGETSSQSLPSRKCDPPNLINIPEDRFYSSLEVLGYSYSGYFKDVSSMKRRLNFSSTTIQVPPQEDVSEPILLHPALLDSALQGIFLAYCWPGDGSLDQLHVPTGIKSFRVNVGVCKKELVPETEVESCSHLIGDPLTTKQLFGDVDIYTADGTGLVQIEGIKVVPFAEQTAETDRTMFSDHVWDVAYPNCELAMGGERASAEDYEFAYAMERVSIYYMKQLVALFPETDRKTMQLEWHYVCLFEFFSDVLSTVEAETRKCAQKKWLEDTEADVASVKAKFAHRVDMKLACAVGDNLPAVIRGETTILEHLTKDNLLDRFYEVGLGLKEFSSFLGKTVKQAVHRHPRMKILEIGAGTGGATKLIMGEINRTFSSYTFTDISTGFFETAQEVFASVGEKMIFKTLDAEKDITEQGYEEHSYDLVVASLVLHATTDLQRTLANTRRLLKPGGHLIILEVINNDVTRVGFLMCALPGWWLGQNDGRKLSPCVSTVEWHRLLLQSGFAGVDSSTPEYDVTPFPLAIIVSQAIDSRIALLREPLSSSGMQARGDKWELVLIGGQSLSSIQLIEEIVGVAQPLGIKNTVFKTIGEIDTAKISAKSAILCLTELDEPLFKRLSERTLEGMKRLFETQRTVLWVTQGCRSEDPYMNMSVGLGRSLILENPDLVLQFLDLEIGVKPNPRQLLESLLRLFQGDIWEKEGNLDDVLWTNEHELAYENGDLMLSRVYHNNTLNNRFNAARRAVFKPMNPNTVPLNLSTGPSKQTLVHDHFLAAKILNDDAGSDVLIRVSYSLLIPVLATKTNQLYLVFGTSKATEKSVVAISANNGSFALVSPDKVLEIEVPAGKESQFLSHLDIQLHVEKILSICQKDSTLLLHEPSPEIASSLMERSSNANITVVFTTSSFIPTDKPWTRIDMHSSKRVIKSSIPSNVSVFINCSTCAQNERLGSIIGSSLPQPCVLTTLDAIQTQQNGRHFSVADLSENFNHMVQRALEETLKPKLPYSLPSIGLEQLVGQSESSQVVPAVVDWVATTGVPVQISTVDSQVTLRSDRTYVLFGLTSDLAQSLCDWMASHGARNIVLTSRNPKIDTKWVELLAMAGVRLEVFANDITNKESLSTLINHLRQTFPPIAGVAHGAMVLDDISFFEMPFEKMDKVLQPKVKGAIFLDEIFQDNTLDFFIFFSSVTAIAGNRGQSAYTTANMFMSSLATQRRKKGLAASILHIGAVMGVGYINRGFSESIFTALRKVGFMLMSEREFQLCFGEAIQASHPLSGRNPEIITALGTIKLGDIPPQWAKFPRFQHCIQVDDGGETPVQRKTITVSTKIRLAEATTVEEIFEIIQDAFFHKLQVALQIPAENNKFQILSSGTDDLGIDSLVAVEIRSWFLKEIETEIPVFVVLSGGSVTQLLEYAVENMPARLTPNRNDTSKVSELHTSNVLQPSPGSDSLVQISSESSAEISRLSDEQDKEVASSATSLQLIESNDVSKTSFEKILPVSPGQSRFWFLKHLIEDQTTANSTISVYIEGTIRLESLESAVRKIASRHEALRTSFYTDETQRPVQAVSETSRLCLEKVAITNESQVAEEFEILKNHVYDIEHGECMRLVHLSLTPTEGYLFIGSHHIIMDGISLEVFLTDLQKAYNGQNLPEQAYQYSDYSEKLRQEIECGEMQDEIKYWKSEFLEELSPLPLLPFATVKTRMTLQAYEHISVSRSIESSLAKQIENTCHRLKANVFHFHLAVFEVLLFKIFGNRDVCIGMADANRWNDQVANSMGMYLNLLPLRFHLDPKQSFEDVLKATRRKAYLAMSNSRLPFDILLDNVNCERSTAFSPLFQAFINYRNGVNEKRMFDNATVTTTEISLPRTGYDISLDIIENPGDKTRITFMLQKSLYSEIDTMRMLDMYFKLLSDCSGSSNRTLQDASIFSKQDISKAIQLGQGPSMPSKWPETLVHRIGEMIVKNPNQISIAETIGKLWTYQELDEEVTRIASALLHASITTQSVVAVYQEASPQFIFSLLAILRTGAIYVPLDLNIPKERLRVILAECKPSALLVNETTFSQTSSLELLPSVVVVNISNLPSEKPVAHTINIRASSPAAILFTSGTSGVPKGVVLSHGGLRNHVEALIHTHGFGSEIVLQQSSAGFDMSLNQIFIALANAGTLVIVPEALRKDPLAIAKIVLDQNITYTSATPSEYLAWLRHGADSLFQSEAWRYATAGGEQFPAELAHGFRCLKNYFRHSFRAFNAYGPTETSMSSNEIEVSLKVQGSQHLPAGRALPNYNVYITDENLTPLPVGFPGEICIGGAGVALAYLNNPDESRKRFLKDPMSSPFATKNGWDRMYRTGDKGKLQADGTLEVLGRIDGDTQIKLRGLRIELQDVEQSILETALGNVREVVVTPRGDPTILIAHAVLWSSNFVENIEEYLRELAASLPIPQYMRPAAIIPIQAMPLTASKKVDRQALQNLPIPSTPQRMGSAVELTEPESRLAKIWGEILPQQVQDLRAIEESSDFFHVGGNSMLLMELRELIRKRFRVHLPLVRLFEHSTLRAMAAAIQNISPDQMTEINWEVETEVPPNFLKLSIPGAPAQPNRSRRTIVLTGSTGFLGNHILRLLVESPVVDRIYCIAVRNGDKLSEFANSKKVVWYAGNLSLARCGLSEADAALIFHSVDAIIHNGAEVSFLKTYSTLRAPNLSSTKELVKLALARCIPFHFISTATVGKLNKSDSLAPKSLASFVPDSAFADGYAASKWASEVFLEKANRQTGLPVFIHRPSSITGDKVGETDIVSNVSKFAPIIKALPDTRQWRGFVDLITIENASAGIIRSVLRERPVNITETRVEYLHHGGDTVIPAQSIREFMNHDESSEWESLSMRDWAERAVENGMSSLVREFLCSVDKGQGVLIGQRLLKGDGAR